MGSAALACPCTADPGAAVSCFPPQALIISTITAGNSTKPPNMTIFRTFLSFTVTPPALICGEPSLVMTVPV
jgi:hypothetical protein